MNRYVFFGNDENSVAFLKLLDKKYLPQIIITGKSRKSGRGRKMTESPPALFAREYGIECMQVSCREHGEVAKRLIDMQIEYSLVFSYGCLIPERLLSIPRRMSVNIHPSMLPQLRGAAPINRAIMNGLESTGVTFFKMTDKMDAGPIIKQERVAMDDTMTSVELRDKLLEKAATMFMSFPWDKDFTVTEQDNNNATYAPKITKEELFLQQDESAEQAVRRINGLSEKGVRFNAENRVIKLRKAKLIENKSNNAGICLTVSNRELLLKCSKGTARILSIQSAGKNTVTGKQFINGNKLKDGDNICAEYSE